MTPALLPAQGSQRDGPRQSDPPARRPPGHPSGGAARRPPLPPPPASLARRRQAAPGARGCPKTPTERVHLGGMRRRRRGDWAEGHRPPPPEGGGGTTRPPPLRIQGDPPTPPPTRRPRRRRPPTPPEAEGTVPPPPGRAAAPGREAGAGTASTPQPPAPAGTAMDKRTRANTQGRHTDRAQGQQASTNRSGMGSTPSMARVRPRTPTLLPAQGRQRDGPRQGDPPPHWPPRTHRRGEPRTGRPPPPPHPGAGTPQTRRPTPWGAHSPKPGRGETGPGRPPPQANGTEHGTEAGHAEWARTAWNVPTSAQHRDRARCARHTNQGREGGVRTLPEHERRHTQITRGENQKGNRTKPAERTDRMEWRTSKRG